LAQRLAGRSLTASPWGPPIGDEAIWKPPDELVAIGDIVEPLTNFDQVAVEFDRECFGRGRHYWALRSAGWSRSMCSEIALRISAARLRSFARATTRSFSRTLLSTNAWTCARSVVAFFSIALKVPAGGRLSPALAEVGTGFGTGLTE